MKYPVKSSVLTVMHALLLAGALLAVSYQVSAEEAAPGQPVPAPQLPPQESTLTAEPQKPLVLSPDEVKAVEFILHHKGEALWKETLNALNARQIKVLDDYKRAQAFIELGRYNDALVMLTEPAKVLPDDPDIQPEMTRLLVVAPYTSQLQLLGQAGNVMRMGINYYLQGYTSLGLHRMAYSLTFVPLPAHRELFERLSEMAGEKIDIDLDSPMNGVEQELSAALQAFQKSDYTKSVSLCEEAIEMEPNSALAYKRLGSSLYALKDFSKAEDAWAKSLEINPNDPDRSMLLEYINNAKNKRAQQI